MFFLVAALTVWLSHDARAFYNASTGRWLSRDPVNETGGRNLYAALQNQLVNVADNLGRFDVSLAYKGLSFYHKAQRGSPSEYLWTAFLMGFSGLDNASLGGKGTVLSRFSVGLTVRTCCGETRRSSASTKFFATPFKFIDSYSGDLATFAPVEQTTPSLNYSPSAPNYENYIWFAPVDLSINTFLADPMGDSTWRGTLGHLVIIWEYQVLPSGYPVDLGGFTPPHTGGSGPLLWPETDHAYSTERQPPEWSTKINNGSSFLEFSWDSCNKSSRPYGTSFDCPTPASGLSRLDRWDQVQAYAPDSEYWPGQE